MPKIVVIERIKRLQQLTGALGNELLFRGSATDDGTRLERKVITQFMGAPLMQNFPQQLPATRECRGGEGLSNGLDPG